MSKNELVKAGPTAVARIEKGKRVQKNKEVVVDTGSGSMAYNRFEMQVSQTLHMAIELFDSLDYLLVLDYYDDITLFRKWLMFRIILIYMRI